MICSTGRGMQQAASDRRARRTGPRRPRLAWASPSIRPASRQASSSVLPRAAAYSTTRAMVERPMPRVGVLMIRSRATPSRGLFTRCKIGQHVLDFLALIELQAVDHLIRHGMFAQGEFQRARQGVGAVENREIARPALPGRDVDGDFQGDRFGLDPIVPDRSPCEPEDLRRFR